VSKFDYGMKDEDPVTKYLFYSKDEKEPPKKMKKKDVSNMLPEIFLVSKYCISINYFFSLSLWNFS